MTTHYDLAIVGAGIVGLAHALAAVRRGKRTIVIDRDAQANGASVRNFGFVTVTGQQPGATWERARRSRDVWRKIAMHADIPVLHRGTLVAAHSAEAMAVLEEFAGGPMGEGCEVLTAAAAHDRCPMLRRQELLGVLWSPHELRVEPRAAIPKLAHYLAQQGVHFRRNGWVTAVEPPRIETTAGRIEAEACVVCPGAELLGLFAERIAAYRLQLCKLHMLRLAPQPHGWTLPAAIMADLSLVRYLGFVECPSSALLRQRLEREARAALNHGIHLIVTQSADGSLVIGDSHHYAATPDPFAAMEVDDLILDQATAVLEIPDPRVVERWIGVYPYAADRPAFIDAPSAAVRIAIVTGGTGMSTAFAIAEETLAGLYGA